MTDSVSHSKVRIHIQFNPRTIFSNELRISLSPSLYDAIADKIGIRYVYFNVNVNRKFEKFEVGQYYGIANLEYNNNEPTIANNHNKIWSFHVKRNTNMNDVVYAWIAVQYNNRYFNKPLPPLAFGSETYSESSSKPSTANNKNCQPSITEIYRRRQSLCKGELLFDENFDEFDRNIWNEEIRIPLAQYDAEFVLYNGTTHVRDGNLEINAQLYFDDIRHGSIDLGTR